MTEIIKLDNHTWRIEDGFVRFFLLEGTNKAILLDTGVQTPNALEIAQSLTQKPIILMNTHADPDHISGNESFDKVYMDTREEDNYRLHGGKLDIVPVSDGEVFDLGERVLQIISTPGHTPGSICVLDKGAKVLYSGDTVQNDSIYMFGERRNIKNFIASINKLIAMKSEFDKIYGCHGLEVLGTEVLSEIKEAAETIACGRASGNPVEIRGTEVMHYQFPCCGFFCDK